MIGQFTNGFKNFVMEVCRAVYETEALVLGGAVPSTTIAGEAEEKIAGNVVRGGSSAPLIQIIMTIHTFLNYRASYRMLGCGLSQLINWGTRRLMPRSVSLNPFSRRAEFLS